MVDDIGINLSGLENRLALADRDVPEFPNQALYLLPLFLRHHFTGRNEINLTQQRAIPARGYSGLLHSSRAAQKAAVTKPANCQSRRRSERLTRLGHPPLKPRDNMALCTRSARSQLRISRVPSWRPYTA